METLKFLQIADLAGCGTWEPWLPCLSAARQQKLAGAGVEALRRAVEIARTERADVLVCRGGLFDDRTVTADEARELFGILESLDPAPVLIVPGEADPLHPYSFHEPRFYESQTGVGHPRNVSIVSSADDPWQQRLLAPLRAADSNPDCTPRPSRRSRFEGLLGTVQGGKLQSDSLQRISLDASSLIPVSVTVTPAMTEVGQLAATVADAAREAGATSADLIVATLQGTASPELLGQSWRPLSEDDAGDWFALVLDDTSLAPVRPERGRGPGTEDRMVQCLLRRLIPADASTDSVPPLTSVRVALQALRSGRVDIPDVD